MPRQELCAHSAHTGQYLGVFFADGVIIGGIYALIALGFKP